MSDPKGSREALSEIASAPLVPFRGVQQLEFLARGHQNLEVAALNVQGEFIEQPEAHAIEEPGVKAQPNVREVS